MKRSPMKRGDVIRRSRPRRTVAIQGVICYADGREKCDKTKAGQLEYARRREAMWKRQHGVCGLRLAASCPVFVPLEKATFEHQDGRGMGGSKRDDRIEIDGKPYNLMSCYWCNLVKGSRSLEACGKAAK